MVQFCAPALALSLYIPGDLSAPDETVATQFCFHVLGGIAAGVARACGLQVAVAQEEQRDGGVGSLAGDSFPCL